MQFRIVYVRRTARVHWHTVCEAGHTICEIVRTVCSVEPRAVTASVTAVAAVAGVDGVSLDLYRDLVRVFGGTGLSATNQ